MFLAWTWRNISNISRLRSYFTATQTLCYINIWPADPFEIHRGRRAEVKGQSHNTLMVDVKNGRGMQGKAIRGAAGVSPVCDEWQGGGDMWQPWLARSGRWLVAWSKQGEGGRGQGRSYDGDRRQFMLCPERVWKKLLSGAETFNLSVNWSISRKLLMCHVILDWCKKSFLLIKHVLYHFGHFWWEVHLVCVIFHSLIL